MKPSTFAHAPPPRVHSLRRTGEKTSGSGLGRAPALLVQLRAGARRKENRMTRIKRPLVAAGAAALLALSLSACGGGAPTDASKKDFCEAVNDEDREKEYGEAALAEDYDKVADLLHEQADEVEKVGTPEDIPDDAREGFEITIEKAKDVSGDDIKKAAAEQNENLGVEFSKDEQDKVDAYDEYEAKTCSDDA